MGPEIVNRVRGSDIQGDFVGRDKITNIILFQDSEREFVVTHNAKIKPVSYFTGRETELEDLRQRAEEGCKSVLVSGMGGIGKTHICRKLFEEYLTRHAKEGDVPFNHIGYVEYRGDMGSSLQNCLKYKKQEQAEDNLEAAWRELEYLASDGKLLLFVDNVDKTLDDDPSLQRLNTIPGAIVLTSRQTSCGDEFEVLPIGFLSMAQCKEIYEKIRYKGSGKKVSEEETRDLEYVIEHLAGWHTITVEFLAHLAFKRKWTATRLRAELEEKGFRLQFRKDGRLVNIQESYEVLYDLSRLTEAEQNILEAFSVFPYIPLAMETCNEWLLADAGASEDDDILIGLYEKGWLQFDMESESFALHPVFAQFIYEKCTPVLEKHMGLIESCKESLKIPESGSAAGCQVYLPFAESILEKVDMKKELEAIEFIEVFAYLLYYIAEYSKSEELYKKILQIRKTILEEEDPDIATCYNNLASVYDSQGEYKKSKGLYEKSLWIREKMLGKKHPDTMCSRNNLAHVYSNMGEYKKAKGLYEENLWNSEKVLGREDPAIARCYNNLAFVHYKEGEYKKAEALYEKCLRISENVLGKEHPDTVSSYNNLAVVYESEGKYKKAEELYEKGLRIREKVLGEEHPDTASSYNNLAAVYESEGKYKKAEKLYEKSLQIREKVLGEEHPNTTISYNNLAGIYFREGKREKAEELYVKSLRMRKKMFGDEHPDTAISYNNLGLLYSSQRRYVLALAFCMKAYKIFEKKFDVEHPRIKIIRHNVETIYAKWNPEGDFNQWLEDQMKE